jgi:hypothetical protein
MEDDMVRGGEWELFAAKGVSKRSEAWCSWNRDLWWSPHS